MVIFFRPLLCTRPQLFICPNNKKRRPEGRTANRQMSDSTKTEQTYKHRNRALEFRSKWQSICASYNKSRFKLVELTKDYLIT